MMMNERYNNYFGAGAVLIVTAALILFVVVLTDRGDLTSATLVLSGIGCFVGGIFVLTLSKGEPVDQAVISALPVAGTINLSRVASDLGLMGDGVYIPQNNGSPAVMQFIPAGTYEHAVLQNDFSFAIGKNSTGLVFVPQGLPLFDHLCRETGLILASDESELLVSVGEVCSDVLEVADSANAVRSGDSIVVTLNNFRLYSGCKMVRAESPKCCTMVGCPVCSCIGCMLAAATSTPCSLVDVSVDDRKQSIALVYSYHADAGV
ncbi:hypothetical protein [Methanofollis fontis]|uniref:DUF7982 domain-containing protein n=1 Tax=Methanofollis fontis TaxID=2052832 RepID=A0A483CLQ2_9EURY|nr:hypothetical protein [Methanofollis fontis]TAJ43929.1 hypothetical protein CUJ86_07685 [Methanofollis fontis]